MRGSDKKLIVYGVSVFALLAPTTIASAKDRRHDSPAAVTSVTTEEIARSGQSASDLLKWCPKVAEPIIVGSNGKVGSGAQFKKKALGAAKGLVGGLLGVGGGGGGSSKPSTVRCKIKNKEMTVFSDPLTGIELQVGARRNGDNVEIFSRVSDSPDRGTFQTTYVEREGGDFRTPIELGMCDIYGEFKLTVSWTKDTYVNGEHVDHQEGGWSELGNFKIPGMASSDDAPDGYWRMLGFSNASAGAKQIKTTYSVPQTAGPDDPFAFTVHVTRPGEDPVTTVPFTIMMQETADGFSFSEAPQYCAQQPSIAENTDDGPQRFADNAGAPVGGNAQTVGANAGSTAGGEADAPFGLRASHFNSGGQYRALQAANPASSILNEVGGTRFGGDQSARTGRNRRALTLKGGDLANSASAKTIDQASNNRAALDPKNDMPHDDDGVIVRTFGRNEDLSEFPAENWEIAAAAALDDMMTFGNADVDRIISNAEYIQSLHEDPGAAEAEEEFRQQQAAFLIETIARKNELLTATQFSELWSERRKVLQELKDYTRIAELDGVWTLDEKAIHDEIADRLTTLMQFTPEEQAALAKQTAIRDEAVKQIIGMADWLGQVSDEDYQFIENAAYVADEIIDWQNFKLPKLGPINLGEINMTFTGETASWVQEDITKARKAILRAETVKLAAKLYMEDPTASEALKDAARDIYLSADLMSAMKESELAHDYFVITSGFAADMIMFGAAKPASAAAEKTAEGIRYVGRRGKEWIRSLLGKTDDVVDHYIDSQRAFAARGKDAADRLGVNADEIEGIYQMSIDPLPLDGNIAKQIGINNLRNLLQFEDLVTHALEKGVPQPVLDDILARARQSGTVTAFTEVARTELALEIIKARAGQIVIDGGRFTKNNLDSFTEFFTDAIGRVPEQAPITANIEVIRNMVRRAKTSGADFVAPQTPDEFRAIMDIVEMSDRGVRSIYFFDAIEHALGELVDPNFMAGARGYMDAVGRDIQRAFDAAIAPPPPSLADEIAGIVNDNAATILHEFDPRLFLDAPTSPSLGTTVGGGSTIITDAAGQPIVRLGGAGNAIVDGGVTVITDAAGNPIGGAGTTIITDAAGTPITGSSATIITDVAGNPIVHAGGPGAAISNGASTIITEGSQTAGGFTTIITDAAGNPVVRLGDGAGAAAAEGGATILTDAAGNPLNARSSTIIEDFGKTWIENPASLGDTMIFELEMPYVADNFYRSFGNFGARKNQGYLFSFDKKLTFAERLSVEGERIIIEIGSKLGSGNAPATSNDSVYNCPYSLDAESSPFNSTSLVKINFTDDAPQAAKDCINSASNVARWEVDKVRSVQIQSTGVSAGASTTGLLPQPAFDAIGANSAAARAGAGAQAIVAVIDSGLDWRHPDFDAAGNLWYNIDEIPDNDIDDDHNGYVDDVIGWNFISDTNLPWDRLGHGTFVSGVIAAKTDGRGVDGVNPDARIMPLKAVDDAGVTRASLIVEAITYAVANGADVINISASGAGVSEIEEDAIRFARERGVIVVVAAGNNGNEVDGFGPAHSEAAIVVAATDLAATKAVRSNHGRTIDIAAPGNAIIGLRARNGSMADIAKARATGQSDGDAAYYQASGSSFSAAMVAGAASLVRSRWPNYSADEVERVLLHAAQDTHDAGVDEVTGFGLLDIEAALKADPKFFITPSLTSVRSSEDDNRDLLIYGSADADQFDEAELFIGEGANPEKWKRVEKIKEPVSSGRLATIKRPSERDADAWTLRLVVTHQNGAVRETRMPLNMQ